MTPPDSSSLKSRDARPREQVAVFSIAEYRFVISAASIQEIRSTDSLGGTVVELDRPVLRKVRHIVERDARSYYVVSGYEHFHLRLSRPGTVLILRGAPVAVLVDRIEEMAEMRVLLALPQSFHGEERTWYRGLTVLDRKVLPVASPMGFLTASELQRLEEHSPGLLHTAPRPRDERDGYGRGN
jgi:chemotaxis signal transduction protein